MIAIGCDHAATELKNKIKNRLESQGLTVKDFGCHSNQAVDYPDYAIAVAKAVASGECEKGQFRGCDIGRALRRSEKLASGGSVGFCYEL